jgi:poly-gamma-glutamate capsule biosynthesis protein CapA/YwtB (metallophosphatase superfamily)
MIFWCLTLVTSALAAGQPKNQAPPPVTVAAVGDIMLGSDFPYPELPPEDGRALFDGVRGLLGQADLSFGNLEGTLCDGGLCVKNTESANVYAFRTPTRFARTLKDAHFKVLSLANNHSRDFGYMGMWATKQALKKAGIQFSSRDGEVAEFNLRGLTVGLMAVSFGPRPRSINHPEEVLREIDFLSRKYDILLISVHGGKEGKSALRTQNKTEYFLGENRGNLVRFARSAVERGADLILGHGPHVPRALEVYKGRLIAYSLGNFCTYKGMNLDEEKGYAPLLWTELGPAGAFRRGRIYSFIQYRPGGPKKDPQQRALGLMRTLSLQDFPASSPLITASGEIRLLPRQAQADSFE